MNKRLIGKNTWNYRVFKEDDPDGFLFVRKVFYDKNGKIIDYDREDAAICGIDRKDMLAIGKLILEDIGRSGKPLYEKDICQHRGITSHTFKVGMECPDCGAILW